MDAALIVEKKTHFDVVIVGGGLVGASLACALKEQNLTVSLIDKVVFSDPKPCDFLDARALALSPTSIQILTAINIWHQLAAEAEPIVEIQISKQGRWSKTRLRAKEHQLPALGYVVNADRLNQVLNQSLETIPNLECFCPNAINHLFRNEKENTWTIQLNGGKTVTTNLLVSAEGSGSYLRKHLGIEAKIYDYHQTAMVLNIELEQAHQGIAYERFTDTSSLALLPFGENRVKCVWALPTETIRALEKLSDDVLLREIQENFGYQLGQFVKLGRRVFYPLQSVQAESLYGDRTVFIGNAANTVHPVAAQGFNLGLRDVATLAERLVSAKKSTQDIGAVELLGAYANLRQNDHLKVLRFTHCLAEPGILQWLGILACESLPSFKRWVTKQGLGDVKVKINKNG